MNPEKYSSKNIEKRDWEPIDKSFESHGTVFRIRERDDNTVEAVLSAENGREISFEDLLPEGYVIHGNKAAYETDKYYGIGTVETSRHIRDPDNKAVLISERELDEQGWKYILSLLHEIGHAVDSVENPEAWDRFQEACSDFYTDKTKDNWRRAAKERSERERRAWAFSIKEFRNILKDFDIPQDDVFSSKDELMSFVNDISFIPKLVSEEGFLDDLPEEITAEEKERLVDELFSMYIH